MFIVWGQRPYFRSAKVKSHGFCHHCEKFVKRQSFDARTFFHLYYVPLVPTTARMRHHQVCSKCQQYIALTPEEFDQTVTELKSRSAKAMIALIEGEPNVTFDIDDGESEVIDCVEFLVDVVDWLYDAGELSFVNDMATKLGQSQQSLAQQMMQATLSRLQGRRRDAIQQWQGLMKHHPEHSLPGKRVAPLLTLEKRHAEAADAWNKTLAVETDPGYRLGLLANRVESLMAAKQWAEAVKVYDELFAAEPAIAMDKTVNKAYRKAKKRAGVA